MAVPPSHHPEEQTDRVEKRSQSQHSKRSPALKSDPMDDLFTVLDRLLDQRCWVAVIHQAVEIKASQRRRLEQNQRDPTSSEYSTTGHIVMVIGQKPDVEKHAAALAPNHVSESQYEHESPSQGEAGGEPLDEPGASSRPSSRMLFPTIAL